MKKILISFAFLANIASANTINAIAVVVDKEPITTYEINQTMKTLNVERNQALGILINEKMENSQIKQFGIFTNELEVDNAIEKILQQNHINLTQFKNNLKAKGQNYEQFRSNLKKDLDKRKLYDKIANLSKIDYSNEGAKNFLEQHKEKFTLYTNIAVNIYTSTNPKFLESIKNTKTGVLKASHANLTPANSDPRLLGLLSQIPNGSFSPILNGKNGYKLYEVKAKNGAEIPDFEQVKNEVLNAYVNEQRQNFIQDYFDKLRSKINIEYLR